MEVRNSMFAAYIDGFTTNTYVMVIMSDPSIREFYYSFLVVVVVVIVVVVDFMIIKQTLTSW